MATAEHDAEHTAAYPPEADQSATDGEPEIRDRAAEEAASPGTRAGSGRRRRLGLIAAGVALLALAVVVVKVVNPSLAVLPPVIREPVGAGRTSASGPAEPTPDLAAASLAPTASPTASPTQAVRPPSPPGGLAAPLSLEAESAETAGVRVRRLDSASGGKVVGSLDRTDDHVTFVVTVPAAGRYTMTLYYISGGTDSRTAVISVNSGAPTSVRCAATGWETVGSLAVPVDLAAGGNRIRFGTAGGEAPDLDRIVIRS